jgi:hypothetical protein
VQSTTGVCCSRYIPHVPAPCTLHPAPCTLHPAPCHLDSFTVPRVAYLALFLMLQLSGAIHLCILLWMEAWCSDVTSQAMPLRACVLFSVVFLLSLKTCFSCALPSRVVTFHVYLGWRCVCILLVPGTIAAGVLMYLCRYVLTSPTRRMPARTPAHKHDMCVCVCVCVQYLRPGESVLDPPDVSSLPLRMYAPTYRVNFYLCPKLFISYYK